MKPEKCPFYKKKMCPCDDGFYSNADYNWFVCPATCLIVELNKRVDEQEGETTKLWLHLSTLCDFSEWNRRDITQLQREVNELRKAVCDLRIHAVGCCAGSNSRDILIPKLRKEIATLKEGEDCPDCDSNNKGELHPGTVNGEVPPEQCEWCHENPFSKFNRAKYREWKK